MLHKELKEVTIGTEIISQSLSLSLAQEIVNNIC